MVMFGLAISITLIMVGIYIFSLSRYIFSLSRAKCINTEISIAEVKVVDAHYKPSSIVHVHTGKTIILVPTPEESKITVQYNGKEYCFNEKDIYQKYSDQIGEYVKGTLETKQYDDGTVSYDIISLE